MASRQMMVAPGIFINADSNGRSFMVGPGVYYNEESISNPDPLDAQSGSFSITGTDSSLFYGHLVSADSGIYSVSGSDAGLYIIYTLDAQSSSYVISGTDATLSKASLLDSAAGSFAISGTDASLLVTHTLPLDSGVYDVSGTDAGLFIGYPLTASSGLYSVSGTDATFSRTYVVSSASGSYVISGTDVTFLYGRVFNVDSGQFLINGSDATLALVGIYEIDADTTEFSISGTDAGLNVGHKLSVDSGVYSVTGTNSTLLRNYLIGANAATYNHSGTNAGLLCDRNLGLDGGSYVISGTNAGLNLGKSLSADSGSFLLSGIDANFEWNRVLAANTSLFTITGTAASLRSSASNRYEEQVFITESESILGFWRLNESFGASVAVDSSDGGNDSVDIGSVIFGAETYLGGDETNTGTQFPGSPIGYIQLEDNINSGPLSAAQFTITAWINFPSTPYGTVVSTGTGGVSACPIVTKGRSETDTVGFNINYFLGITAAGKLVGDFESSTGTNHPITGGTTLAANRWYFAVLTYNGSSLRIYLNGVSDATPISTSDVPDVTTAQPACIGSAMTTAAVAAGGINAYIDEVAIWNTALSAGQILTLWDTGRVTKALAGSCSGVSGVSGGVLISSGLVDIENFNLSTSRVGNFGLLYSSSKTFNLRK